jgi:para-nitrobenzyl esterase
MVVVTANYRLGALGYIYMAGLNDDERGAANRGLLDQIAALSWVHHNIASFGGNPEAITIAGQSAGGAAVAAMMADNRVRRLFKRAILQSPVLEPAASIDEAAAIRDHFLGVLGITRDIRRILALPIERLLAAQSETAKLFTRFGAPIGAIQQVVDGVVIRGDLIEGASRAAATGMEVMAGTTRDEMDAFLMQEPFRSCDRQQMLHLLSGGKRESRGGQGPPPIQSGAGSLEAMFEAYSAALPGHSPAKVASAVLTDQHFRIPVLEFAKAWSDAGGSAYLYRFDWSPKADSRYGACHCIDIPFVFNNLEDWESADLRPAMLEGCDPAQFKDLSQLVQNAWASFAYSGHPCHERLPDWPKCTSSELSSMCFDVERRLALKTESRQTT